MVSSPSKGARVAAGIVCAVFVPFVLIHLLWATGNTWGLKAVSGDQLGGGVEHASTGLTVVSLFGAAAGVAVIIVTISRVGWLKTPLSDRLLHLGNWVAFAWPAIGTLNPLTTWRQRAVALPLAIAALVVARSHPRPHAGEAPRHPVMRPHRHAHQAVAPEGIGQACTRLGPDSSESAAAPSSALSRMRESRHLRGLLFFSPKAGFHDDAADRASHPLDVPWAPALGRFDGPREALLALQRVDGQIGSQRVRSSIGLRDALLGKPVATRHTSPEVSALPPRPTRPGATHPDQYRGNQRQPSQTAKRRLVDPLAESLLDDLPSWSLIPFAGPRPHP
jgi:hypothetical protein